MGERALKLLSTLLKTIRTHVVLSAFLTMGCAESSERSQVLSGAEYVTVAGILTQNPITKEWYLTVDEGHAVLNMAWVSTEVDAVLIGFPFEAKKVISLTVTGDASYAERGFTFGGQVGTQSARIFYGAPMPGGFRRVTTEEAYVANANIMIVGVFLVDRR